MPNYLSQCPIPYRNTHYLSQHLLSDYLSQCPITYRNAQLPIATPTIYRNAHYLSRHGRGSRAGTNLVAGSLATDSVSNRRRILSPIRDGFCL